MARRYFNWKLAIVLVVGLAVLCVTAYGLRQWQKETRAERGLELGNKAYEQKDYEEAARCLGRYVGVYQDDIPAMLKYADAHLNIRPLKRNNVQQAIGTYDVILTKEPTNSEAARRLVGLHLNMGVFGEAERIAKEFVDVTADSTVRTLWATALVGQRKYDEAVAEFQSIIADEPNQVLVYESLGRIAEQFGDESAQPPAHWYDEAVKNNPSAALAYTVRAGFYLRSGGKAKALAELAKAEEFKAKALAELAKAEELDLTETNTRLRLAVEFLNAGEPDRAEQHLIAVKEKEPDNQGLWNLWGQLARTSNSKEKMLEVAENGLESLSAAPWDFMPAAAEFLIRGGKLDRAAECIEKLNQKDINPAEVASLRAMLADQKGDPRQTVQYWRQSIALGNADPQAQLRLARALLAMGDTQSAMRQLRQFRTFLAQQRKPKSFSGRLDLAKLHSDLARLFFQVEDWAGFADHAGKALKLAPGNTESTLLDLQAKVQLFTADPNSVNDQDWDDITAQLLALEDSAADVLQVKLLRVHVMVQRKQFAEATDLLTELKKEHPSEYRVAMAEVGLLADQGREKADEAIAMLNEIMKKFPEVAEPVIFLAGLYDRRGDRPKSEAVIKQATERIKDPPSRRNLGLQLARLYDQWGRAEDACTVLEALSSEEPDSIPIRRRLLNNSSLAKDPNKAQKLVDRIKALEGDEGRQWRIEQARLWFNGTDFDKHSSEIISILKENLLANPDDQQSRIVLAHTYERIGRLQMALATYREALNRSPQDVELIASTVTALLNAHEYDEAARILSRISKEGLTSPELQRLQFQNVIRRGDLDSAANMLKGYLVTDPNNIPMGLSLAVLKMQQGEFDDARELLDELRAKDPNSLPTIVAQIELNVSEDKADEALKLCDEIIEDHDNSMAYLIRARAYFNLKQLDKAAEDFDRAVSMYPKNADVWIARSDFYAFSGQRENSMADMEQALSLAPDNPSVQGLAVDMFLTSGKREKVRQARTIIDRSLESNPDNADLRFLKARSLLGEPTAPSIQNAIQILEKLTQDRPEFSEAWRMLAQVLTRQGQSARAIDTILEGLVHNDKNKALLMLKARAEAAKSPFLAIATLKQLLALDPNDITAAMRLADAYVATNEPDKAENLLRELLARCDASLRRTCRIVLAAAMYANDKKAEAQAEFDSLVAAEPNDPAPILQEVGLLGEDKLWDRIESKAVDWYQKHPEDIETPLAIANTLASNDDAVPGKAAENILRMLFKDHEGDIRIAGTLAILMQRLDRNDEAAEFYRRVIEIRPDDVVSLNNLAWIVCEHQDKHAEALELAQKGLKIAPKYIDLIDTRGVAYYRMGRFTDAIRDFTDCIELYPEETAAVTAAYFHLARAFAKVKDANNALENLNKALSLNERLGGLSGHDLAEANDLLEELSKEGG